MAKISGSFKTVLEQEMRQQKEQIMAKENIKTAMSSMAIDLVKMQPKIKLAEEVMKKFLETTDPVIKQFVNDCLVAADIEVQITLK